MNNLTKIRVFCDLPTALRKLSRADIPVYCLKKHTNTLTFCIEDEYLQKAFAIFSHRCYNISVVRESAAKRVRRFLSRRVAFPLGALLFVSSACVANSLVLKIKVTGSGAYLADTVKSIARDCGAEEWRFAKSVDGATLIARVLALPNVIFCTVKKEGSYLIVDVQTEENDSSLVSASPLVSTVAGVIVRAVAVCGTLEKSAGEEVSAGDIIIGAYTIDSDGVRTECLAAGFAQIECVSTVLYGAEKESEENLKLALASADLYADDIIKREHKVKKNGEGVIYEVTYTYRTTLSVNMQ